MVTNNLDENGNLLDDGVNTYVYGYTRLAQMSDADTGYFLTDALGSVRHANFAPPSVLREWGETDASGAITLVRDYSPYGETVQSLGSFETPYSYTGEMTDASGLVYLRARYYDPATGRFVSRDAWEGENQNPISLGKWIYAYSNPLVFVDPRGHSSLVYGISIDDKFTSREKALIVNTIADFAELLGSSEALDHNLALREIKRDWVDYYGNYNAAYSSSNQTIYLQPGWYSPVVTTTPSGRALIILASPCLEDLLGFPEGSLPSDKVGAKFVLAHEIGLAFAVGNPGTENDFEQHVDLPFMMFAFLSDNHLIERYQWRTPAEVFSDMIAAYLYSPGLLNDQMFTWIEEDMPETLK